MDISKALDHVLDNNDLGADEMHSIMQQLMTGQLSEVHIAALLVALRMKGESVDEIAAATQVMRELATPVTVDVPHLVDIVGTGGDGAKLFNVSTASSFVAAAAGCHVAKHGNRSVSSSSGSADLLEAAGVRLDITPEQVAQCIEEVGVGFMFAQKHHSAMRHAIGVRKALGIRTLFNMLGPLTNPAGVKRQLLGVYDRALVRPIADVLNSLNSEHVMVVHSDDGLDEISVATDTYVAELRDGKVTEYVINPNSVGLPLRRLDGLSVSGAEESLSLIRAAFSGENMAAHDMLALNAGAAIYIAGVTQDLAAGVNLAQDVMLSGQAAEKLKQLADFSQLLS